MAAVLPGTTHSVAAEVGLLRQIALPLWKTWNCSWKTIARGTSYSLIVNSKMVFCLFVCLQNSQRKSTSGLILKIKTPKLLLPCWVRCGLSKIEQGRCELNERNLSPLHMLTLDSNALSPSLGAECKCSCPEKWPQQITSQPRRSRLGIIVPFTCKQTFVHIK